MLITFYGELSVVDGTNGGLGIGDWGLGKKLFLFSPAPLLLCSSAPLSPPSPPSPYSLITTKSPNRGLLPAGRLIIVECLFRRNLGVDLIEYE
ncbi:hypothetical protein Nos7524_0469 [Nostoc sp. PCC 7524]|nr:hypothetical protein Nos7524_0469 [Nostoc sp. PCC 7524]